MKIYITKHIDPKFIDTLKKYVSDRIIIYGRSNFSNKYKVDQYLINNVFTNKRTYNSMQIFTMVGYNLDVQIYKDHFTIEVNREIVFPYYHKIKLIDLLQLLDQGNTEINGNHYISDLFTDIEKNIDYVYELYLKGKLKCH